MPGSLEERGGTPSASSQTSSPSAPACAVPLDVSACPQSRQQASEEYSRAPAENGLELILRDFDGFGHDRSIYALPLQTMI